MLSPKELDELATENFRAYLRFPTVHPNPDYTAAVQWLRAQGEAMGLECFVTEPVPKNPILVMRWQGVDRSLHSVMLNSHVDVVPVDPGKWTHDPFGAEMTPDGNIYGRGAQDMKCVGIQQLESVRRLKMEGFVPKRTIYLTFVPDEEVGGGCGMQPFVAGCQPTHPGAPNEIKFADMNVGFCLDEGIASPLPNDLYAFYEERCSWWVSFIIPGRAGHGSKFIEDTAVEKLYRLMGKLLSFRDSEKKKFEAVEDSTLGLGSVITTNVNVIHGGVQTNVVPAEIEVRVDFRLPPTVDFTKFDHQLHEWASEAGDGIKIHFLQKDMGVVDRGCLTDAHSLNDPLLRAVKKVTSSAGINLQVGCFFGSTDARYVRRWHLSSSKDPIKAINFSPMRNTPVLLHDHDEFLNRETFLEGVRIYTSLLREVDLIEETH